MNNLDVHGLTLSQAQEIINRAIKLAYENNVSVLYINHGFNNGQKIKSWCKNKLINNELLTVRSTASRLFFHGSS